MSNEDKFFLQIARASSQRAVWRNGGSNPAENDVRTRTEIVRLTCSESRRCAKPPGRCVQAGTRALQKATCELERELQRKRKVWQDTREALRAGKINKQ